jgi:hypothetical protein
MTGFLSLVLEFCTSILFLCLTAGALVITLMFVRDFMEQYRD